MTRTQSKTAENNAVYSRMTEELSKVIREEFPVGTKVRWQIGKHWQSGIIAEAAVYEWSNEVTVRNARTGTTRRIRAAELELDQ